MCVCVCKVHRVKVSTKKVFHSKQCGVVHLQAGKAKARILELVLNDCILSFAGYFQLVSVVW